MAEQPGAHLQSTFEAQRQAGECPILSHMLWCCMKGGKPWANRDATFIKLWREFGSWGAVLDAAPRTERVMRSGKPMEYTASKRAPSKGDGVDLQRVGKLMLYAKRVSECASIGGNQGIIACSLQDVLENVKAHPSSNGQLSLQWLRALPAKARRVALQDLALVKDQESKIVTLVCNFIQTLGDDKDEK